MKKIKHMNEAAWVIGILVCAFGVALCTKANYGLSMVAAPAYIIHVWMHQFFSWYSQGTSEYIFQGLIMIIMCVVIGRFKPKYLLSFGTAVVSGLAIDMWLFVLGGNGAYVSAIERIVAFCIGEASIALAVAFFFRTTLPIQVYELAVCEISDRFGFDKNKTKMWNDIIMFVLSFGLSLLLTGTFTGVGIGTVIITIVNAPLITLFGKIIDRFFVFDSAFKKTKTSESA